MESLGPAEEAHGHDEEAGDEPGQTGTFEATAPTVAHLRLALFAVKDGNAHDAEHHLEDLVGALEDEHVKGQAEDILAKIQAGVDPHDIEHEMEQLVGEIDPEASEADGPSFHLQLVLDGLTLADLEAAGHHLDHYADLVEDDELAAGARELKAHLEEGELQVVEDEVTAFLFGQESDHQD